MPATVTPGAELIALHLPPGWTLSGDGLVAAEDPADLTAVAPTGAVVRAQLLAAFADDFDTSMDAAFAEGAAGTPVEVSPPEQRDVDGSPAVAIVVRTQDRVQVLVSADTPGLESVLFVLDAPADRFEDLEQIMRSVPGFAT